MSEVESLEAKLAELTDDEMKQAGGGILQGIGSLTELPKDRIAGN